MRVKFIKDFGTNKKDDIVQVSPNVGFGLIDSGTAIITKDMTEKDYKITKSDEVQADGKSTILRSHKLK